MKSERFCSRCDIAMELHVSERDDEVEPWECEIARQKLRTINEFYGAFRR